MGDLKDDRTEVGFKDLNNARTLDEEGGRKDTMTEVEVDAKFKVCFAILKGLSMVHTYQHTKQSYQQLLADAAEIERRANEAGVQLVKAEEKLHEMKSEVQELTSARQNQETLLGEIELVCTSRGYMVLYILKTCMGWVANNLQVSMT